MLGHEGRDEVLPTGWRRVVQLQDDGHGCELVVLVAVAADERVALVALRGRTPRVLLDVFRVKAGVSLMGLHLEGGAVGLDRLGGGRRRSLRGSRRGRRRDGDRLLDRRGDGVRSRHGRRCTGAGSGRRNARASRGRCAG